MNIIINPGSGEVKNSGEGWTNTHETARWNAYEWFYKPMVNEGFKDIKVTDTKEEDDGRWKFLFTHQVTGKVIELEVHGIDNMDAYTKEFIFTPRVYWNGSSSSNPELEQFAADGYEPVMTYRKKS